MARRLPPIEVKSRRVVQIRTLVRVGDQMFESRDLVDTLEEVAGSNAVITNPRMAEVLKRAGVIKHAGSSKWEMGAEVGPNYRRFMDKVERLLRRDEPVPAQRFQAWTREWREKREKKK